MHVAETAEGHSLASLAPGLPKGCYLLRDDVAAVFRGKEKTEITAYDIREEMQG